MDGWLGPGATSPFERSTTFSLLDEIRSTWRKIVDLLTRRQAGWAGKSASVDFPAGVGLVLVSATLQSEADPTLEIEATGSCFLVCRVLGLDAGQGVYPAVA